MPRKDSPRSEPQSRRDRWDEAVDPSQRRTPTTGTDGREQDAQPDSGGQSGYGAGDGLLDGAGAWSGRANPQNASPGSGPVPNEGTLRTSTPTKRRTAKKTTAGKTSSAAAKRSRKR